MQSIFTKYLPATNFRGSRIKATSSGGYSLITGWDDSIGTEENHNIAAIMLCQKLSWTGKLAVGANKAGNGNIYVFINDFDIMTV